MASFTKVGYCVWGAREWCTLSMPWYTISSAVSLVTLWVRVSFVSRSSGSVVGVVESCELSGSHTHVAGAVVSTRDELANLQQWQHALEVANPATL